MKRVLLISGISGAGKSTLANKLKSYLAEKGQETLVIDGDSMREFFEGDYKYSAEERLQVSKIITYGASLLAEAKANVILASMFSQPGAREFLNRKLDVVEVFLDATLEDCKDNDVKDVYKKQLAEESPELVGHDLEYSRPSSPDLILNTHQETVEESFEKLIGFLKEKSLFLGEV